MLAADEWEEARLKLESWLEIFPQDDRILRELALIYSHQDRHRQAAEMFLTLYDRFPEESEHLLFAAQSNEAAGQEAEAIQFYRLYLAINPDNAPLWRITARLEQDRGYHRQALDAYFQSYRLQPDDQVALQKGELFLTLNNLPQARQWLTTAAAEDSRVRDDAILGLIEIGLLEEEWEEVETLLADLKERNRELYDHTGLISVEEQLIAWRETLAEAEAIRITTQARGGDEEEEERETETRTTTRTETREADRTESDEQATEEEEEERLLLAEGDRDDDRSMKEMVLFDDPESMTEEETVATTSVDTETESVELPEITAESETEITEPEDPEPVRPARRPAREIARELTEEGRSLADRGRTDEAIATFWSSLAHFDRDPETWYYLSRTFMRERRFEEAEATILEARRLDPDSLAYYSHYFFAAREIRPLRLFIREVEEALDRFPNNPDLLLLLAQAYTRGEYSRAEAVRLYQRFLRQAPTDHPARRPVENFLAGRTAEVSPPAP